MTEDWEGVWNSRQAALSALLGPTDGRVFHALIPLELGGSADVLHFSQHLRGSVYVTADLTGGETSQPESELGNYELMLCLREPADWAPSLISKLAPYTFEAVLSPNETMDIGSALPPGSSLCALFFAHYASFQLNGKNCGLLLCLGITNDELEACLVGQNAAVLAALKAQGVYPFTDLSRQSVAL